MNSQLIKKVTGGTEKVFPKTYIEAIKDQLTNQSLDNILAHFNMLHLPYVGSRQDTRKQIPQFMRRKGLWITYVDYDDKIRTEWYKHDRIIDECWEDDQYWNVSLELSDLLNQYFNSNPFKELFNNVVKNIVTALFTEEFARPLIDDFLRNLDLPQQNRDQVDQYLNSNEFDNTVKNFINLKLAEYVNKETLQEALEKYFQDIDMMDIIDQYVNTLDLTPIFNEYFSTDEGKEKVNDAIQPQLEEIVGQYFEAVQEYLRQTERVIANALARHEQAITDLQNA